MREVISTKNAAPAGGPYSQAIKANGFVFVAGQIAVDPATGEASGLIHGFHLHMFGVNLFVPGGPTADQDGLVAYLAELEPDAAAMRDLGCGECDPGFV